MRHGVAGSRIAKAPAGQRTGAFLVGLALVVSILLAVPSPSFADGPYPETTGGVTHTWTDYQDAGGQQGPAIPSNETVQITCRLTGFAVKDGNTWWLPNSITAME